MSRPPAHGAAARLAAFFLTPRPQPSPAERPDGVDAAAGSARSVPGPQPSGRLAGGAPPKAEAGLESPAVRGPAAWRAAPADPGAILSSLAPSPRPTPAATPPWWATAGPDADAPPAPGATPGERADGSGPVALASVLAAASRPALTGDPPWWASGGRDDDAASHPGAAPAAESAEPGRAAVRLDEGEVESEHRGLGFAPNAPAAPPAAGGVWCDEAVRALPAAGGGGREDGSAPAVHAAADRPRDPQAPGGRRSRKRLRRPPGAARAYRFRVHGSGTPSLLPGFALAPMVLPEPGPGPLAAALGRVAAVGLPAPLAEPAARRPAPVARAIRLAAPEASTRPGASAPRRRVGTSGTAVPAPGGVSGAAGLDGPALAAAPGTTGDGRSDLRGVRAVEGAGESDPRGVPAAGGAGGSGSRGVRAAGGAGGSDPRGGRAGGDGVALPSGRLDSAVDLVGGPAAARGSLPAAVASPDRRDPTGEPADADRAPAPRLATGRRRSGGGSPPPGRAPSICVVGAGAGAASLGAAVAQRLSRAHRRQPVILAAWGVRAPGGPRPATAAARRLAATLALAECGDVRASGRTVLVTLPDPPAVATAEAAALAARGEPVVVVLAGPRSDAFEKLLAAHDLVVVAAPAGGPAGLGDLAVAAVTRAAPSAPVHRVDLGARGPAAAQTASLWRVLEAL